MDEQPWSRQRLRSNNELLLLEHLRGVGTATRAELARQTGLSKPTVSSALAALEQGGLVREVGTIVPERGRSAVLYEPDPTAGYVLGVDIGRARLRVAVADLAGDIQARVDVPNEGTTADAVADAVAAAAERALAEAGVSADRVVHAAVGTPGVFDAESGRVRYAVNLPGWGRVGLVQQLRAQLGGPELSIHNDANLAALGEYAVGAGQGSRLFVYVLVGTGLGMGVVADGQLFTGAHGAAGEIGFLPLSLTSPDPATVAAGRRGALEDAVAADAIVRTARELGLADAPSAKHVFDAARAGDPRALQAVAREGERLALVVAAVSAVLDPDLVVLGGGVGHSADLLLDPVRDALHRMTPLRPEVSESTLGDDAVLLGAITCALRSARPAVFERHATGAG
ncbi:ROK family transcriptional regulator [Streptacidiphilus jiangxiensis]|uniref:Sugar kinase of the NBD/HSP70 family, may contain an N-terminal HTH domain n=1 Tax=Streptacidiphilus jiangxiensis TaxID=235985 RepID=A0A1H7TLN9_STRJI|nr:ROK family protein [Streptacidiphilus jiangxiensis]SEL85792.1 Sugar kinase of the NBD/HSP70 family, may contain an N-terminal HTH domain [Streptacidiphilus jiangxiensis]